MNGRPLDAPEFRPVFKTLADRGVPILLHPARSSNHADYATEQESKYLIWQVFGWPYETTAAAMRLVFSGIMQDHPGLKILVHHTAAMIPFFHGRMKSMFDMFAEDFGIQTEGRLTQAPDRILPPVLRRPGRVLARRRQRRPRFSRRRPPAVRHRRAVRCDRWPVLDSRSIAAVKNSSCTEAEKADIFTGQRRAILQPRREPDDTAAAAPARFRNPWWVVFGSMVGLIVGNGPIVFFTFGLFLGPVTREFGWDRATFSSSLLVGHGFAAAAYPFLGRAIDRYGIRRVSLTSIVLFAVSFASLSLTPPSSTVFIAMAGLVGLLSAGQAPLPYAKAVSSWFDERRGLALGIAMTGIGIGATLVPQFAARGDRGLRMARRLRRARRADVRGRVSGRRDLHSRT